MSLGLFKRLIIEKNTKKVISKIMRNVNQTLQANPRLTVEESLSIIDKKKGIFFPSEQLPPTDLKSLFTMIVWKSYQYECSRDPAAASPEHREIVVKMVNDYLNGKDPAKIKFLPHVKSDKNFIHHKVIRPASLAISALMVLVFFGLMISFHTKTQGSLNHSGKTKYLSPMIQNNHFRYNGLLSNEQDRLAVVNKAIHQEGDVIGDHGRYMLKKIYPKFIVIQNRSDRSEFHVHMQ
ncbi:MAG: hypothetical protein CVU43_16915 [Chloroflexi bacterium HGW-Chloroflexi-5]|jgi:hypothetical protein|nr:MAG: hypothetical protein CVU43_16915 [Chloroflexi bacterium HGW-Chloroflexi-5]